MRHLFIVNGLGLGNSSRCLTLLRELEAQGDSVDVLTAHNGLAFFRNQKLKGEVHAQEQVSYGESFRARSLLGVLFDNLLILWRNSRRQKALIEKNHYDVIWLDSDLGHLFWRRTGARIHAVNHSYLVVRDYFKVPRTLRRGSSFHFLLKLLDFAVTYLRADLIVCPEVTERSPEVTLGKIELRGPLARFSREVKREVISLPTGSIKDRLTIVDLTASLAGKKTRLLFERLASFDPALSETLLELFSSLSRTHLMYSYFKRAYSPGTEVVTACDDHELDAVVLTSWNGVSLLANGRWLSLPNRSRMIILIHETLRLAQMFTPWFRGVSDQELQYITMLIHSHNFKALEGMDFYSRFRAYRSALGRGGDEATSYRILRETLLRGKKDEFSEMAGKLLPQLGRSPESILTDIRLNDAEYKQIVDEAVFRRLQKK